MHYDPVPVRAHFRPAHARGVVVALHFQLPDLQLGIAAAALDGSSRRAQLLALEPGLTGGTIQFAQVAVVVECGNQLARNLRIDLRGGERRFSIAHRKLGIHQLDLQLRKLLGCARARLFDIGFDLAQLARRLAGVDAQHHIALPDLCSFRDEIADHHRRGIRLRRVEGLRINRLHFAGENGNGTCDYRACDRQRADGEHGAQFSAAHAAAHRVRPCRRAGGCCVARARRCRDRG